MVLMEAFRVWASLYYSAVSRKNGKMRACSLGLVVLGLRFRDKVRVSVRDRVGVRVSTFYFLSH